MPGKHNRNGRSARNYQSPPHVYNLSANSLPTHPPSPLPAADDDLLPPPMTRPYSLLEPHSVSPEPASSNESPAPTLSSLLDFDQHPSAPPASTITAPRRAVQSEPEVVDPEEVLDIRNVHRSPPFIQAPLPSLDEVLAKEDVGTFFHSPRPLISKPRMASLNVEDNLELDDSASVVSGHTRSPVLAREQTTLESFSRTLRTYVPSSIHIPVPRSAPSPPLVSRPVSFGSFSASRDIPSHLSQHHHHHNHVEHMQQHESGRRGMDVGHAAAAAVAAPRSGANRTSHGRNHSYVPDNAPAHSGLTQALHVDRYRNSSIERFNGTFRGMSYPGSDVTHADPILWSRWDKVHDRRLLILAYPSGFQLWDCTDLSSVTEVLNLNMNTSEWQGGGDIVHVAMLPAPHSRVVRRFGDPLAEDRPLLGIAMKSDSHRDTSTLFIYSLSRQYIIKRLSISGSMVTFDSNDYFLVISTTNPPALQILSPTTFEEVYTIASKSLVAFTPNSTSLYPNINQIASKLFPSASSSTSNNKNKSNDHVFLGSQSDGQQQGQHGQRQKQQQDASSSSSKAGASRPVFALSHRLIAFASSPSPATRQAQYHVPSSDSSSASPSSSPFGLGGLNMPMSQAELGNAALKVGGSLLSGMKTLSGIALSAAKNRIAMNNNDTISTSSPESRRHQQQHKRYVSTSAPSANHLEPGDDRRERRYSNTSMTSQDSTGRSHSGGSEQFHSTSPVPPNTLATARAGSENHGSYVTVLDLAPLLEVGGVTGSGAVAAGGGVGMGGPVVVTVAEFLTSRSGQPIAGLHFSHDGCSLAVVPQNGQVLQVYQIKPDPTVSRRIQAAATATANSPESGSSAQDQAVARVGSVREVVRNQDAVVRVYNLHRGRSQAVVDDVNWAHDGRWVAIGTQRPTVHVFAVNPYGGKPDPRSHIKGKVVNVHELQPSPVEVSPLARLRAVRPPAPDQPKVTLAFRFIESSEACLPSSLLPASTLPPASDVNSSPHHRTRPTNYQDLLVFDPNDGMLSLRRITTEVRLKDQSGGGVGGGMSSVAASMSGLGAATAVATSISLPKMAAAAGFGGNGNSASGVGNGAGGAAGAKLSLGSGSPGSIVFSQSVASNASSSMSNRITEATHELVGKETIVATWNLQRRRDWEEIRQPIIDVKPSMPTIRERTEASGQVNYLAQAELSTFSRSPNVLPRSIYLSHQFSFYSLGEDYHALIRRSQLDITGCKIDVRKEVEISAFPSSMASEAFVEGFSAPRDSRRHSASFDEPLASALAGGLEYTSPSSPILPMYPNGAPGSRPRSFRNSIPIRTIGEGMSESLSRLRREINKVRSPHLMPRVDNSGGAGNTSTSPGLVPLEFDEEDEDFLLSRDENERNKGGGEGGEEEAAWDGYSTIRGMPGGNGGSVVAEEVPGPSLLSPSTVDHGMIPDDLTDDGSTGWDWQDRQAVEEQERFDDISVGVVEGSDKEREREKVVVDRRMLATGKKKTKARRR
ncbi:hypothetical protein AMATHDRAFT_68396 [Amanita thiersii Skay4041]|uniref:BCAS3 WD40 domain-containing protein n=1 Tax=Amanita thiersii Skay4041 TaxID=703135 RepID=A0A2A9NCR9_9AGAR|nr:hypothetical protein AMATHDRAFT_68396 [Amanita thiersii Skay4041]